MQVKYCFFQMALVIIGFLCHTFAPEFVERFSLIATTRKNAKNALSDGLKLSDSKIKTRYNAILFYIRICIRRTSR